MSDSVTAPEDQGKGIRPRRIQRQRTKGWRMPEGAIYVGRPSQWGNPYRVGQDHPWYPPGRVIVTAQFAVDLFEKDLTSTDRHHIKVGLRGHDLACWCPLDQPCHADVLLAIANGGEA